MGFQRTRIVICFSVFVGFVLTLQSCKIFDRNLNRKKITTEEVIQPRYLITAVGKVSSYEESTGIILVRTIGKVSYGDGSAYVTAGENGSSGNIKLTGQGNNLFVAAELQGGIVAVGDAVLRQRLNPAYVEEEENKKTKPLPPEIKKEETKNIVKPTKVKEEDSLLKDAPQDPLELDKYKKETGGIIPLF